MKAVVFAAAALALAAPSYAETSASSERSVEVAYGDLDLNTPNGQSELRERVNGAIVAACGARAGRPFQEMMSCRAEARENLVERAPARVRAALNPQTEQKVASND